MFHINKTIRRRGDAGFTFIEFIVALTVFSIIAVSIYSVFNAGRKIWLKTNSIIESNQRIRMFFATISSDLKHAFIYTSSGGGVQFDGEPRRVSFMTLIEIAGPDMPLHLEPAKVIYYLDATEKKIKRIVATRKEGFDENQAKAVDLLGVIDEKNFGIEYCYKPATGEGDYIWKDMWNKGDEIPRGIRINAGSYRKVVFIPTGKLGIER